MSRNGRAEQREEPIVLYVRRRIQALRKRLNDLKGKWAEIARDTNINHSTIYRIASGKNTNPDLPTIQVLLDWCEAFDRAAETMQRELKRRRANA